MSTIQIMSAIIGLLFGISLFLFGMGLMGDGLKKIAGNKLEAYLYKLTNTPIKGILLGAAVTAVIQSSSATSVMVVGFVNAGMMKVIQGIGIIMGANIGTSITGWILCLNNIGGEGIGALLGSTTIAAVFAFIGILLKNISKKDSLRYLGDIMLGFAVLMEGMSLMKNAMTDVGNTEAFRSVILKLSNPLLGILVGIVFTAILQSASASIGVLQSISAQSVLPFSVALPMTMGIGIGAAAPVLMSGMQSTSKNGKRTAIVYLVNDLFGCIIWATIFYAGRAIFMAITGHDLAIMNSEMNSVHIALLNTVYRILSNDENGENGVENNNGNGAGAILDEDGNAAGNNGNNEDGNADRNIEDEDTPLNDGLEDSDDNSETETETENSGNKHIGNPEVPKISSIPDPTVYYLIGVALVVIILLGVSLFLSGRNKSKK